jgi:type II secretory pathway pseudopilin PulG
MVSSAKRGRSTAAFNLVELLIVVVLAGIIFAAMVPLFLSAAKGSSDDGIRIAEANIAQDRIEQVRLLSYGVISEANLDTPPSPVSSFGDGRFGHDYLLAGGSRPYYIDYTVDPGTKTKKVTVSVSRSDSSYVTTMTTVIQDPTAAVVTTVSGSPSPTPSPSSTTGYYTITVTFKNWTYVTSNGVKVVRTDVTPNTTMPPAKQVPDASHQTLYWTGLPGGPNITYVVWCYTTHGTFQTPTFHLLSDCPIHFDTNPGGN